MAFYANLAATAERLLTKYGEAATFTRPATGFDPVTGAVSGSATTYSMQVAKFGYRNSEIDGDRVQQGDVRLLAYSATEPAVDDRVALDSESYRVINFRRLKPAGTVVAYEVQVRR